MVKSAGVPVRAFVMFMLGFMLLVGPVNLWVLSRLRHRTWMLWTIPAISLLTSVCVLALSLLSEGVTPSVRMESVVILDQVNHRAASLGAVAYYCPVAPRGGLKFGYDTELTPLGGEPSGEVRRDVDWTTCQHLVGEWVSARLPMHFLVRRSEPRRERIQIEWVDAQPMVINGLGAQVQMLWFADASGRIYRGGPICPGPGPRSSRPSWARMPRPLLRSGMCSARCTTAGTQLRWRTTLLGICGRARTWPSSIAIRFWPRG